MKVNDDIFQSLEDHLMQLSVIKASKYNKIKKYTPTCFLICFMINYVCRYISVFLNEADFLEKSIGLIMEVLEIILSVQRQHIYLEVNVYFLQ